MPFRMTEEERSGLSYDLDSAIAEYAQAREAHKATEGVPAPSADPIVETIVKKFNGRYQIMPTAMYARVVEGRIMDKRKLPQAPADPEWVPATADMHVGYVWDVDTEVWRKPDSGKGATAEQLAQAEVVIGELEGRLMKAETAIKFQLQMIEALQLENEEIRQRLNDIVASLG